AIWQAKSLFVGSLFLLGFLAAIALLGGIAWSILHACATFSRQKVVTRKIALRNLSRNRLGAVSCFLAIGLGALLINLIPQIQKGLESEIMRPESFTVPDFFMFDIQQEQLEALQSILAEHGYATS